MVVKAKMVIKIIMMDKVIKIKWTEIMYKMEIMIISVKLLLRQCRGFKLLIILQLKVNRWQVLIIIIILIKNRKIISRERMRDK